MKVLVVNKETEQEVEYNNVLNYFANGATWDDENEKPRPVIQFLLPDGTATFHTDEWDWFILKR